MAFGSPSPGVRLQRRMVALTMISSTINILLIVPFLLRTLDWSSDQWTVLWYALAFWIPALALISHRLQGSVRELARWLDLEAAGKATRADEVRAFGGSIALVRETLVNSYLLWPVGAACISLTLKWLTTETTWMDVGALCAAGGLGAAVSTPTVAWVFRREVDPYRARLARIVDDPEQRERAVRRLPIGWKLQSTVLFTSAVPILVMMLVTHRQIGLIAGEFAHAQQREWLEADEPENLASSTHAPFGTLGGGWWLLDPATGRTVAQSRPDLTGDPRAALAGREEASGEGANGEAYYAWQRNARGDRVLVTMLPRSALAHFTSPGFEIPALIALSLTIAFAAAWIVSRDLSSGIAALRLEADRITKGDLQRATVYESEDELGALGRDFDRMRQSLRETVGRVASAADRVDDAAGALARIGASVAEAAAHQERGVAQARESTDTVREQASGITRSAQALSSSVEESSSSILEMGAAGEQLNHTASALSGRVDEVSSSVEEMVRGVAEMARHVESLAEAATDTQSSISEMAGSMRDVDSNAAETARLSAQVVAVAEGGRERVQQTIAGMEAIRDATDTVEKVIRGLGERAREIGAIVDVIDDVADETNLLALNAAIIAAQAGEHGRAFSVVADEIKELADRVMASTKEIGSLIRGVQSESEAAVAAIERGAESVWTGVERSAEAGESLEAITRTARESGSRIAEIVQAVQEQTRAASHVQALMESVRVGVDQLRHATHEQEQGHEIVLRGTTGMRDAAQQVHRTTEEQARGSNQIRQGIEVVRSAVEQIHRALQDQSEACEQSARFMGQVSSRARTNHEAAGELSQGAEALRAAAQAMRENIERFRI